VEEPVKLVKCIVREHRVEQTTDALKQIDVSGVTVTHVLGSGRRRNPTGVYRGHAFELRHTPQMMIDVVVADDLVDEVVRIVMEAARTGERGDGRIFVIPVEEAYTIRTRCGGAD
jgi:nitrogen regulatory protein P-II 1